MTREMEYAKCMVVLRKIVRLWDAHRKRICGSQK